MNFRKIRMSRRCLIIYVCAIVFLGCGDSEPTNSRPVIDRFIVPEQVEPGATVEFQVIAHDADGDALTIVWEVELGELTSSTERVVKWTAPSDLKTTVVKVHVSDGVTKSVIRSQKVSTKLDNAPPVIKEIIVPENVFAGDSLELSAEVDDADGDALTYHWVVSKGELDSDTTEHPTWTAPIDEGTIIISLTVNDGVNEPTTETIRMRVTHTLIVPGKGAAGIRLGDRFARIKALYGAPEDRDGGLLNYWAIGLNFNLAAADFVKHIWVRKPNTAKTEGGAGPGSGRNRVIDEFGEAEEIKDGGTNHWYWKKGIQFRYANNARVESVMIFSPTRVGLAPAALQDFNQQKQELRELERSLVRSLTR